MKVVPLDETTLTLSALADMAKDGTVILTRKGRPLVAVKDVSGSDWESLSLASNTQFMALIEESRRSHQEQGGMGLQQLRRELRLDGDGRPSRGSQGRLKKRRGTT
jgi:hypothetical protein